MAKPNVLYTFTELEYRSFRYQIFIKNFQTKKQILYQKFFVSDFFQIFLVKVFIFSYIYSNFIFFHGLSYIDTSGKWREPLFGSQ